MKQFYAPYWEWEDYKNGMYCDKKIDSESYLVVKCMDLFTNTCLFYSTGCEVFIKWPIATKVNLTNKSINRRAWLGTAICNLGLNAPEYIIRLAWNKLYDYQKERANSVATNLIYEYETQNFGLPKKMGANGLF